jgi:hypothetical protein
MLNMRWWKVGSFVAAFTAVVGIAWASGDWSSAKDSVEKLKNRQGDLRKLSIDEQAKIVTAICAADRDEREAPARMPLTASRVR